MALEQLPACGTVCIERANHILCQFYGGKVAAEVASLERFVHRYRSGCDYRPLRLILIHGASPIRMESCVRDIGPEVREPELRSWGLRQFGAVVFRTLLLLSDIGSLEEGPPQEMMCHVHLTAPKPKRDRNNFMGRRGCCACNLGVATI